MKPTTQRQFLSSLSLLLLLNLLIKPLYLLGIDAEVQERTGAGEYGLFFALMNFAFLFNIIADFGISNRNAREAAIEGGFSLEEAAYTAGLRILLAFCYLSITLCAGYFAGYSGDALGLLLLLSFNQVLASLILYYRSFLSGKHFFTSDSIISVLDRFIMILIAGFLLMNSESYFEVEWLAWTQTAAYGITAATAIMMLRKKGLSTRVQFSLSHSAEIIRRSFPYALLVSMMMIYNRTDGVMLERMLSDGGVAAGIYARSYRIFEALTMVAYLFAVLLLPIFSRSIKEGTPIRALGSRAMELLVFGSVSCAVIAWYYPDTILSWRYEEPGHQSAEVFRWLMVGFVAVSLSYVTGTLLTAGERLVWLTGISAVCIVLNIALNYTLIPEIGAKGSAIATAITQWVALVLQVVCILLWFRRGPGVGLIKRLTGFSLVAAALTYGSTIIEANCSYKLLVLSGLFILAGITTGVLNMRAFRELATERMVP
jgi:O-antigen/teichoic acid export membrane protein